MRRTFRTIALYWTIIFLFLVFLAVPSGIAQVHPDFATQPITIPLWQGAAPSAQGTAPEDVPTLTLFRPFSVENGKETRTAVIVAPGGAYISLADNHEGRQVANWLNSLGITALVLKYRLAPRYHHPVQLQDIQRAIRLVRSRAAEFGIATDRIGVMGFSAGGHLAAMAGTHFGAANPSPADATDHLSSRPDFLVLGYPLISYVSSWADPTFRNLATLGVGAEPDENIIKDGTCRHSQHPSCLSVLHQHR